MQKRLKDYAELARLGRVTRARMSQIMSLLNLATDIQEAILFLPKTVKGRDPISFRDVIRLAAEVDWERQREGWHFRNPVVPRLAFWND